MFTELGIGLVLDLHPATGLVHGLHQAPGLVLELHPAPRLLLDLHTVPRVVLGLHPAHWSGRQTSGWNRVGRKVAYLLTGGFLPKSTFRKIKKEVSYQCFGPSLSLAVITWVFWSLLHS